GGVVGFNFAERFIDAHGHVVGALQGVSEPGEVLERERNALRGHASCKCTRSGRYGLRPRTHAAERPLLLGHETVDSRYIRDGCQIDVNPDLLEECAGLRALLIGNPRIAHPARRIIRWPWQALDLAAFLVGHYQQSGIAPFARRLLQLSYG